MLRLHAAAHILWQHRHNASNGTGQEKPKNPHILLHGDATPAC